MVSRKHHFLPAISDALNELCYTVSEAYIDGCHAAAPGTPYAALALTHRVIHGLVDPQRACT